MQPILSYKVHHFYGETKRYCQTLRLKNDPNGINEYVRLHSEEHHWKEITEGIRQVGILEMEIYRYEELLFMIIETPADFDRTTAMARLAEMPRQAEWEQTVAAYQLCIADDKSTDKWKLMERIFHLY